MGRGDLLEQGRQVLENIRLILEDNGSGMSDIVKVTVFVTDMQAFDALEEVRNSYFAECPPASTIVEVSRLAKPEWMVEIEAIAAPAS